ncbi:CHS1 [Ecytonucleospora hepatopenaei]|uniref:chitin synthase n=1 Tax=Ecytonucleospora hepatopenaei TaxID=646526 RepID=A0A1W0E4U2_9MICR|nr:CHS1 [Ecytonucleospora hepatopenaei]
MLTSAQILTNSSRTTFPAPLATRENTGVGVWYYVSRIMTFFIPTWAIRKFAKVDSEEQVQAWREKMALCLIVFLCCTFLAGITYGINKFICNNSHIMVHNKLTPKTFKNVDILIGNGAIYEADENFGLENNTHLISKESTACKKAFGYSDLNSGSIDEGDLRRLTDIYWDWSDVARNGFIVIDGKVYDPNYNDESGLNDFIEAFKGTEVTASNLRKYDKNCIQCFKDSFLAGKISYKTNGCIFGDIVLYSTATMIFALIFVKFILAFIYAWYARTKNTKCRGTTPIILQVTCYSEGKEGLKSTLNSLSSLNYDENYRLILVVCDGDVKGEGEEKTTPETVKEMCEIDEIGTPKSYISLTSGHKRHNRAKVHTGWYYATENLNPQSSNRSRIMIIEKCGNEQETAKKGNRGKRDSQVIVMNFFSKIYYSDRMSELEVDMYHKMKRQFAFKPKDFELILMVDADTIVANDAVDIMAAAFEQDNKVMGLCGETQILNKNESWVTNIQVFEYYISHHLAKNFESVFGGVTCLPGCFCCYRLKLMTDQYGVIKNFTDLPNKAKDEVWTMVPLLANPIIINPYSAFEAKTLHEKNLLHLGEDRYLTTLLMKNFYKRKLIFVAKAKCSTYVPAQYSVLRSQRRRWINSTIHNMFELAVVDKLCGTSCFSMQFIIICELFGTLTLPAAIFFTFILVISSIVYEPAWIPLIMLMCILGLPAVLIMLTTFRIEYVYWLLIYILALPVWNFFLPVYAFWRFDDFSWGDTRKVEGEDAKEIEGEFDASKIKFLDYAELDSDEEM